MIASLKGTVSEKLDSMIILDVMGVGYGLYVGGFELDKYQIGRSMKMYVYEHIREQSHDLFGFSSTSSKQLFEYLLTVKNIGPKTALALFDIGDEEYLRRAISEGDLKTLQSAKGIGRRAAEQIVVELRDKVGFSSGIYAEALAGGTASSNEAVQALVSLGYQEKDAFDMLKGVDDALETEEKIKYALRGRG